MFENIYMAVDAGKYNTKVSMYDGSGKPLLIKFRTKISEGDFEDDMFGRGTFIVQIDDGPVYKVGQEAKNEPALETSKRSEIHHVCTMAGAALALSGKKEAVKVDIVTGIPLQICGITRERLEYKKFILGEPGIQHRVKIKTECNGSVSEIRFSFDRQLVYPEGIGALYEYPSRLNGPTGIIDIGNLNTNHLYCDSFLINDEGCFTDEMGGKVLIAGLAATLSSELGTRVDDNMAASVLRRPYEKRALVSMRGDKALEEKSRKVIDSYLKDHVLAIKQRCDTRHWPMEFMNIVCMGGTTKLLSKEIFEVFGKETFIPEDPEYVNVKGFLKKLCADSGIDIGGRVNDRE